jgi:hypothetical protein
MIRVIPSVSRRLAATHRVNRLFIDTALAFENAEVFLDNSHDPYRLRQLSGIPDLAIKVIHLVRDPRGVIESMKRHAGWDTRTATKVWLRRQNDILRIVADGGFTKLTVFHEDLCTATDRTLERIHSFSGLPFERFAGDFKAGEHHILGNAMRLRGGQIQLDERWKSALPPADQEYIATTVKTWRERFGEDTRVIVDRYVN